MIMACVISLQELCYVISMALRILISPRPVHSNFDLWLMICHPRFNSSQGSWSRTAVWPLALGQPKSKLGSALVLSKASFCVPPTNVRVIGITLDLRWPSLNWARWIWALTHHWPENCGLQKVKRNEEGEGHAKNQRS